MQCQGDCLIPTLVWLGAIWVAVFGPLFLYAFLYGRR